MYQEMARHTVESQTGPDPFIELCNDRSDERRGWTMVKTANAVRLKKTMRLGLVIDINCYVTN